MGVLSLILRLISVAIVPGFGGLVVGDISWFYKVLVTLTVERPICFYVLISYPGRVLYYIPWASPVEILKMMPSGHKPG